MPQPQHIQTYMNTFLGKAPMIDGRDAIANMMWRPKVISKTSDYTVLAKESGAIFNTEGATAAVEFTLPAASDGPWIFFFHAAEDVNMTVTAETADTMVTFNNVAADKVAYSTSSEKVGGGFIVYSAGGSVVYVMCLTYDTTDQAVTVTDS